MSARTKIAGLVVIALLVTWAVVAWWPTIWETPTPPTAAFPEPAAAAPAARLPGQPQGGHATEDRNGRRPPPTFTGAAPGAVALETLPDCQRKLDQLRTRWEIEHRASVSTDRARFEVLPPSPKNQQMLAPIISRILSALQPRFEHTLDCRLSRCRLTVLAPKGTSSSSWLRVLQTDPELSQILTASDGQQGWATQTGREVRDALSGAVTEEREAYFTVPASKVGIHPFDVGDDPPGAAATMDDRASSLTNCREKVAALGKLLEGLVGERDAISAMTPRPDSLLGKTFLTAAPSPKLTRDFRAVVDTLVKQGTAPEIGTLECRGESVCRWSFAGARKDDLSDDLRHALQERGYVLKGAQHKVKSVSADEGRTITSETLMLLRIEPAAKN